MPVYAPSPPFLHFSARLLLYHLLPLLLSVCLPACYPKQPHGLSPLDNVLKECAEEAGIPRELAVTARPVGAVSYLTIAANGYKPDVLFCYDIELPPDFVPTPQVGWGLRGGWGRLEGEARVEERGKE